MMGSGFELKVKVSKQELLDMLKNNLDKHKKIVKEANEGYCKLVIKLLKEKIKVLKTGEPISINVAQHFPPMDMTEEYETAIKMLEWSKDDLIELDSYEFKKFVKDDWDWTDKFKTVNSTYAKLY